MKTIGLIGGMSWESSQEYYRIINQEIRARLGGTHSAKSLMWSMDFGEVEHLQHQGKWDELTKLMVEAAQNLEKGGADKMAADIERATSIPLVHIADPTAEKIKAQGLTKVGLLGTAFTMEQDFYKGRLASRHGLEVLTPDDADRKTVHNIIYQELVVGQVRDASREKYRAVIQRLVERGAEAIILGCTEIMLLIGQEDSPVPVFDTTLLHAEAAVERALKS
jgi:aspartate racemase